MVTVPPEGSLLAPILIIGESPGEAEVEQLRPFVGASGKLLDEALAKAGIDRAAECYLTNVIKERPPGNNVSHFIQFGTRSNSLPAVTEAYQAYEASLWDEIGRSKARVIVPLGNVALWAVLRLQGVSRRRGCVFVQRGKGLPTDGRKVLPTLHPAGILRGNYLGKWPFLLDWQKVRAESAEVAFNAPERTLRLRPQLPEVLRYIEECRTFKRVGFDTETTVQKIRSSKYMKDLFCFSLAKTQNDAMAVSLVDEKGRCIYGESQELAIIEALAGLLEDERVTKVGQNLIFDHTLMWEHYGIDTRPMDDTMVAFNKAFQDFPKSLEFLASIYTREPYYKDTGGKFFDGRGVTWDDFLRYSALDAALVLEIFPQIHRTLERLGHAQVENYEHRMAVHGAVSYIQARGWRIDVEEKKKRRADTAKEIRERQAALDGQYYEDVRRLLGEPVVDLGGETVEVREAAVRKAGLLAKGTKFRKGERAKRPDFWDLGLNVKSHRQVIAYFKLLGYKIPKKRRTGAESTETVDKKAVETLIVKGCTAAGAIRDLIRLRDDYVKYWCARLDANGRFRFALHPAGSSFGRFSSTTHWLGIGANGQNQPERFEELVLADEGYWLVNVDLKQSHDWTVAHLAGDATMIETLRTADIHSLTASRLSGLSVDAVREAKCPLWGGGYTWRYVGKRVNHASKYDIRGEELGRQLEIPTATAETFLRAFHALYPNIRAVFHYEIRKQLFANRTLTGLFGEKFRFHDRLGTWGNPNRDVMKPAYTCIPQSTESEILNRWGLEPVYAAKEGKVFWPCELLAQTHDSLKLQYPVRERGEAAFFDMLRALRESLERPLSCKGRTFTIPVEIAFGRNMEEVGAMSKAGGWKG